MARLRRRELIAAGAASALAPAAAEAGPARRRHARVFYAVAASLAVSFVAMVLIEERPLQTNAVPEAK